MEMLRMSITSCQRAYEIRLKCYFLSHVAHASTECPQGSRYPEGLSIHAVHGDAKKITVQANKDDLYHSILAWTQRSYDIVWRI